MPSHTVRWQPTVPTGTDTPVRLAKTTFFASLAGVLLVASITGCVHGVTTSSPGTFHGAPSASTTSARSEPEDLPSDEVNPQGDEASVAAGREVYREFCSECHGPAAKGDGPLGREWQRPPADLTQVARHMSNAELFRVVDHGRANMPSWTDVLTDAKLWSVVHFLRALADGKTTP